ncbi:MAG: hypothetical protein K9M99_08620 [Candidatus Cloacimonetes bacterium]|nr:hypothetical protein [Candidatus Cloacimonadota bacterium]
MKNALIIVILLMLSSLFAAETVQPLYYTDNEIFEYSAVLVQDSTIYVLGKNKDDLFLLEFDQQLDLKSKVKVFEMLPVDEFLPYKNGFLTINRYHTEFTYINRQGELLDKLHLNGLNVIEFERDGQQQIITRVKNQLYLNKINSELSKSEERLILDMGIDRDLTPHRWKLYFAESEFHIFYKNFYGIYRYSFRDDWVLYNQAMIINDLEKSHCAMNIAENRIILSYSRSGKQFVYDFDGNLLDSGAIEVMEQPLEDIVFTKSELKDSLSITSPAGEFNFELLTDFCFIATGYTLINNQEIILIGTKSYYPDWEMPREPLIMLLNSPKSELYLHQSSTADSLEAAYLDNDVKRLAGLFSNWQMKNSPELKPDAEDYEREAYLLFSQVYPKLYKKHGSRYQTINAEIEIILSNKIGVGECHYSSIAGTLEAKHSINERIVLTDFHPDPHIKKDIIYLDKQTTKDLLVYLSRSGIDDTDLKNRMSFLNKYISIEELPWSEKLDIYSQPQIETIIFEPDFTRALVSYKKNHMYGSFFCHKKNGKWIKEKDLPFRVYENFRYFSREL